MEAIKRYRIVLIVILVVVVGYVIYQKPKTKVQVATPQVITSNIPTSRENLVKLLLEPSSDGVIDVAIETAGKSVSSAELVITFDPAFVNVLDIKPGKFFLDSQKGAPVEVVKKIDNTTGKIDYALTFPLGSGHASTENNSLASIYYTQISPGSTQVDFVTDGFPKTELVNEKAQYVHFSSAPVSLTLK